ncbi:MAG TPA: SDR family oxidoreductase [Steroidobacteraceae bacterium]
MSTRQSLGTALVTGASSGIGAMYADRLAQRGYDLILVARDEQRLDQLAARLRDTTGVTVEVLKADLTVKADLTRVEQRVRGDESIAMLVNNAGMAVPRQIVDADPDALEALVQLNVLAPTRLAATVAPGFIARRRGFIVNISSVLAVAPELTSASYGGSKAYVLNFTLSLHQELSASGVQVQAVLPGITRTEIWERSGTDVNSLPAHMIMETAEMVDAALVGLDRKELVTIPSLPDPADWDSFNAARLKLGPNLSHNHAAARYTTSAGDVAVR